jgi:hypothetical protein
MGKNRLGINREKTRPLCPNRLLLFWAAFYPFLLHPFLLLAQEAPEIDLVAPKILHAPPMGIFHGGQEFEIVATVTDAGSGVAGVRLFFRSKGERDYRALEMIADANDRYRSTIPGEAVDDPGVEYYLEAEDRAGNRVQTLRPPDLSPAFVKIKSPTAWERFRADDQPWYKKPWVWTVAGAVVLGAAASMGGGGGGGGGGGAGSPTTGTITVDGPVP